MAETDKTPTAGETWHNAKTKNVVIEKVTTDKSHNAYTYVYVKDGGSYGLGIFRELYNLGEYDEPNAK